MNNEDLAWKLESAGAIQSLEFYTKGTEVHCRCFDKTIGKGITKAQAEAIRKELNKAIIPIADRWVGILRGEVRDAIGPPGAAVKAEDNGVNDHE